MKIECFTAVIFWFVLLTVPWVVCVGTTIRTPAGSDVTVTGDFPAWAACRKVTIDVPVPD